MDIEEFRAIVLEAKVKKDSYCSLELEKIAKNEEKVFDSFMSLSVDGDDGVYVVSEAVKLISADFSIVLFRLFRLMIEEVQL